MTDYLPHSSTLTPDRALGILRSRWRLIVRFIGVFAAVGVGYALLLPDEYTSGASLMPEFQAGSAANLKRFSALADLVGIDLESVSTTEAIRPDLYPDVLRSTPFLLTVLNQPIRTAGKKNYPTLVAFLTTAHGTPLTAWLGGTPQTMPKPDSPDHSVRLSKEQEDLLKDMRRRIVSDLDPQSGLITIQVTMPDAEVAAQVCQSAITYLTSYVVQYRTGKTRKDLTFLTNRLGEAKTRYNRAIRSLSAYSDQNRFLYLQAAQIENKRLQAEHDLSQSLYIDLSRQYEQALLKIQEETPILSVLEPPKVPARHSDPHRALIVLAACVVGLLAGLFMALFGSVRRELWSDIGYNPQPATL